MYIAQKELKVTVRDPNGVRSVIFVPPGEIIPQVETWSYPALISHLNHGFIKWVGENRPPHQTGNYRPIDMAAYRKANPVRLPKQLEQPKTPAGENKGPVHLPKANEPPKTDKANKGPSHHPKAPTEVKEEPNNKGPAHLSPSQDQFPCGECDKTFTKSRALKFHLISKHRKPKDEPKAG